jgi:hypothetical protein
MSQSPTPKNIEPEAPFPGHPFGGLIRDDRFGSLRDLADPPADDNGDDAAKNAAGEDAGGFDFHLGVYARF